ncbi:TetR/AcrR family transcriptional regulator [Pedobacter sp. AW31-3R]|uniref:TetR/AcrR family transcriptional regulator n=1 Tax=Pedobacter sp. AW31-3R TaxID=3445781 RepID=UPI003F9F7C0B
MEKPDKKANILIAAEKLFSELGYEGTSTRQIAKESGANMAMINYYFGSKEGVFFEIMNERLMDFNHQLLSINQDSIPPMEKLMLVIERYAARILNNISFHKMMHRELSLAQRPEMYCRLKDAMTANLTVIENIIKEVVAEGSSKQVDVRMLIATIMGTISNVAIMPSKVTAGSVLEINNAEDREIISQRLILHLKDLIKTYLTAN